MKFRVMNKLTHMRFSALLIVAFCSIALMVSGCNTTSSLDQPLTQKELENIPALKKRADSQFKARKYKQALNVYEVILAQGYDEPDVHFGLAETALKLGDKDKAFEQYSLLIDDPDYKARALQGLGLLELQRGNVDVALESLELAVKNDETLWRAWNGLGQTHDFKGNWKHANISYKKALLHTSDEAVIHNNIGVSYMAQDRFKEAENEFVSAIKYDPKLEAAAVNYKLALAMQNKYEEATIESDEHERAKALNNAGYAAMLKGDYKTAEKMFVKAIEVNPSFYKAAYANLQVLQNLKSKH